jgi:predicted transglutaminase-like cysteine proteinase
MFGGLIKLTMAAAALAAVCVCGAEAAGTESTYAAVGPRTLVPYGWVDFCNRYDECDTPALPAMDVNLTPKSLKMIQRINTWVNTNITPKSDMEHWNVVDRWDYPTDGFGDCEDYALLKRKMLIDEGFPRQGLLLTVVRDSHGDGHAVLTVKTNHGEFVLDNLHDEIKPWTDTRYRFVKRQSQTDQNVWVDLGDPSPAPLMVSR